MYSFFPIGVVALGVGGHSDVDLLQDSGLGAIPFEDSPSGDGGKDSGECVAEVGWKACRAHFVGEGDRFSQTKDGVVIVQCLGRQWGFLLHKAVAHSWESAIGSTDNCK